MARSTLYLQFPDKSQLLIALAERATEDLFATYDPDVAEYWTGRVQGFAGMAQARLERDQAAGSLDADLNAATTAQVVTWMVERNISVHCRLDDGSGDERLAKDLARSIWLTVYGTAAER